MSNLEQLIIDLKLSMERRMDGLQEQIAGVDNVYKGKSQTFGLTWNNWSRT